MENIDFLSEDIEGEAGGFKGTMNILQFIGFGLLVHSVLKFVVTVVNMNMLVWFFKKVLFLILMIISFCVLGFNGYVIWKAKPDFSSDAFFEDVVKTFCDVYEEGETQDAYNLCLEMQDSAELFNLFLVSIFFVGAELVFFFMGICEYCCIGDKAEEKSQSPVEERSSRRGRRSRV